MGCACFSANSKQHNSNLEKTLIAKTKESRILSDNRNFHDETLKIKIRKSLMLRNKNFLYLISPQNWLRILDFLNYADLKESGKTNR